MFHYSLFVGDPETRYDLAFYFMYLVAADIVVNVLYLIYTLVK